MDTPRGLRCNNPGNIRHGADWLGLAPQQTDESFCQFTDPVYGIRAIVRILRSYERQGINTLTGAISRWSPPSENDTAAYIAAVAKDCGIAPDQPVSLDAIMPALVRAIIQHENGQQPYTDDQIERGIALA